MARSDYSDGEITDASGITQGRAENKKNRTAMMCGKIKRRKINSDLYIFA